MAFAAIIETEGQGNRVARLRVLAISVIAALLAGLGLALGSAYALVPTLSPSLYVCREIAAENRVKPPPPLWEQTGQAPPDPSISKALSLRESPCPPGEIAYPKALRGPHGIDPRGASPAEPPSPQFGPGQGYWHAGNGWIPYGVGASINTEIFDPSVSTSTGAHSLGQLAIANDGGVYYTIEVGWNVDPGLYGDTLTHLFTYVNKDHYATNGQLGGDCYNCNLTPAAGATYKVGQTLTPNTHVQIAAEYTGGNWWVWFDNQWIGYVPGSFWGGAFTGTAYHLGFGEIYDPGAVTDMGNGLFGSNPSAAKMYDPFRLVSSGGSIGAVQESLQNNYGNYQDDSNLYNVGTISGDRTNWHFGGPGAG
jgi:hypothetical protein